MAYTPPHNVAVEQVELEEITPADDSPRHHNPPTSGKHHPLEVHGSVVDVHAAEQVFRDLDVSVREDTKKVADVEKGGAADWDIHEFFEDSVRKGEQTGHKLKRMGVIVKNLTVVGLGADAAQIPDNLDMFKALWPPSWYVKISDEEEWGRKEY
jgi:hypothetical protein